MINDKQVGIIMGSKSDWGTMEEAAKVLEQFAVPYEKKIVSAHRSPDLLYRYAEEAEDRGLQVIIAGENHRSCTGCAYPNFSIKWT